jgi:CBS domain-containing protein
MDIASICQRRIVTIEADATLREAAILMRERHVGALVVTDSTDAPRVLGVVTDRDLAISAERAAIAAPLPVFLPNGFPGMH